MPPALDRLLASPSALRLLRSIVDTPELPAACSATAQCCKSTTSRRQYWTDRRSLPAQRWRRWKEASKEVVHRETVRQQLEDDKANGLGESRSTPTWDGKDDDAAWAETLAQQERLKRLQGIKIIWKASRFRQYRLPTDDTPNAEFLWRTFIKNPKIVKEVIDHAADVLQETGNIYPRLYDLIMSYWLPRQPTEASAYHHYMLVKLKLRKLPLRELVRSGKSTFQRAAYEALIDIYRNSNERDLYDDIVPVLIEKGYIGMARRWHSLCTFRDDLPSDDVAAHPVVQIFVAEASSISGSEISFKTTPMSKDAKHLRRYNQDLMQRLLGRDTAPVRYEDAFTARMFATRTFSPASIIQGLAMVGVNEIGPQAVWAMASRTLPVEDLPRRFEELRAAGIALQGCVFSLALEKFAMEQKWQLVRSMLDSDQHPDVFDDADVQRKLLEYYLTKEEFDQAQRTLAILTLFHNDSSTESWNLLLQVHINRTGPEQVVEVLQDMRSRKVMLSHESLIAIRSLLRSRRPGRKPGRSTRGKFDDLRFVTRIYMSILESGSGAIPPPAWREIIVRFGMLGRLRELRRLLLWLLCWYAPRSSRNEFADLPRSPFQESATRRLRAAHPDRNHYFHFPSTIAQRDSPLHPIRQLFKPSLQQALIVWGFRAGVLPHAHLEQSMLGSPLEKKHYRRRLFQSRVLNRLDWSVGLRTIVQLRDLGVYVHRHTVVKALQLQFVMMFGRGHSNKKENRLLERANRTPYAEYVREVNKIWGRPLLTEPELLFSGNKLNKNMWHPRLRRLTERPTFVHLNEILGRNWQHDDSEDAIEDTSKASDIGETANSKALEDLQKHFAAQSEAVNPAFNTTFGLGRRANLRR